MAHNNHAVTGIRTVYLPCRPDLGYISSRFVREIAKYGEDDRPSGAGARRRRTALPSTQTMHHELTTAPMSYDDDEYDEYDDIDDEYPDPAPRAGSSATPRRSCGARSTSSSTAPTMPLSSSPRIDRDEIIELLEESLHRLPDELRQARWMLKERQDFVAKTRREADELLEAARVRAERMVQRTEVVRAAEQRARQVMETAEADSRRLKHETEDFLDQRLGSRSRSCSTSSQKTVGRRSATPVDRWRQPAVDEHRCDRCDRRGRRDQHVSSTRTTEPTVPSGCAHGRPAATVADQRRRAAASARRRSRRRRRRSHGEPLDVDHDAWSATSASRCASNR